MECCAATKGWFVGHHPVWRDRMLRNSYSLALVIPVAFATVLLAAAQEKKEQEPDVIETVGHFHSASWHSWIEPVPCVRADVSLPTTSGQNPVKGLGNLSVSQLHERYKSFQRKIDNAWAESARKLTSIDVPQMENWKKELALTFV